MPPKFRTDYGRPRDVERQALLDGDSDDDDFFLRGPSAQPNRLLREDTQLGQIEREIDDVVDIMKNNIDKTMQRGDRLEDLQDKSDSLSSNADMFRTRSKSLRNKMWWRECRMRILIAVVIAIIITIIIVAVVMKRKK